MRGDFPGPEIAVGWGEEGSVRLEPQEQTWAILAPSRTPESGHTHIGPAQVQVRATSPEDRVTVAIVTPDLPSARIGEWGSQEGLQWFSL